MSSRTRSQAFDQALSLAGLGNVCEVCCQAPSATGRSVVLMNELRDLDECEGCGHPMDENGRLVGVLGAGGQVTVKRIILEGVDLDALHIRPREESEDDVGM